MVIGGQLENPDLSIMAKGVIVVYIYLKKTILLKFNKGYGFIFKAKYLYIYPNIHYQKRV